MTMSSPTHGFVRRKRVEELEKRVKALEIQLELVVSFRQEDRTDLERAWEHIMRITPRTLLTSDDPQPLLADASLEK